MDRLSTRERRHFLLLQGPPSGFWGQLGDALLADGQCVQKINFSLADRCFWGLRPAKSFRGRLAQWAAALERLISEKNITDIVYYNDGLPYHHVASRLAKKRGIRAWCVEFGYLRPDWITLEPDGMNAASRFPKSREDILELARFGSVPDLDLTYPHRFATEATSEVIFNLLQSFGRPLYPFFQSAQTTPALLEYLGWLPHLLRAKQNRRQANALQAQLKDKSSSFFLVALQMETDFQVRSSRFGGMLPFVREVLRSFASSAPAGARLIVKAHPLESGLRNWHARVLRLANEYGLEGRVHFLRGGDLQALLRDVKGLVVLNSTTGMHGILAGTPVVALGDPVYQRQGLTHCTDLDSFWQTAPCPNPDELQNFIKALSVIQIKGSFYNKHGRAKAIAQILKRLTDDGPAAIHALLPEKLPDL